MQQATGSCWKFQQVKPYAKNMGLEVNNNFDPYMWDRQEERGNFNPGIIR